MTIRRAVEGDWAAMWRIFQAVVATGTTYVFDPTTSQDDARAYFFGPGISSYVVEEDDRVIGMYKLIANRRDLGSHVANASFMVDPARQGAGAGRAMGLHCLEEARHAGYLAMQFNFVVSTNEPAVRLWKALGFKIVGVLPGVFRHRDLGYMDAYVMHRFLEEA